MAIRRLFTGGYGALLALCVLIGVLWAGSYRSMAHVKFPVSQGAARWSFTSYRGTLSVSVVDDHPTTDASRVVVRPNEWVMARSWDDHCATGAVAGFSMEHVHVWLENLDEEVVPRRMTAVNVPYAMLLLLAALGPMHFGYVAVRARRRTTHNQCAACGYDLGDGHACQACAARAMVIAPARRMQLVH